MTYHYEYEQAMKYEQGYDEGYEQGFKNGYHQASPTFTIAIITIIGYEFGRYIVRKIFGNN